MSAAANGLPTKIQTNRGINGLATVSDERDPVAVKELVSINIYYDKSFIVFNTMAPLKNDQRGADFRINKYYFFVCGFLDCNFKNDYVSQQSE